MLRKLTFVIAAGALCGATALGVAIGRDTAPEVRAASPQAGDRMAEAAPLSAATLRQDDESAAEEEQIGKQQEAEADISGNPSVAPYKWAGRLVYYDAKAKTGYSCSAQFIAKRILLTAAHCVFNIDQNAYYSPQNMAFILQYQNGTGTQVYHAVCTATLTGYSYPSNYASMSAADKNNAFLTASQWDYGMVLVDADSATGFFTVQTDWKGKWRGATRIGYPEEILGTEIVQRAHGLVFFADDVPIFEKSYPGLVAHWQDNARFTHGSSGGAWVAAAGSEEGDQKNVVISLNSFHVSSDLTAAGTSLPGAEFGPYFKSADYNALYKYVSNGCK
jgi:hypothetical protein